jgi:leucyl-tRNA synthetase
MTNNDNDNVYVVDRTLRDGKQSSDDYQPSVLEKKWQDNWDKQGLYLTPDTDTNRPNRYHATMLPYPSGDLHIGHWWDMAPSDMLARFYRMKGYNVLFPMGFDAFGLPAENAAIQRGIHPQEWTTANIERMRGQLKRMGAMFDWSREINTSSPDYYRWTQWWFLQLFKNGLAYRTETLANWCPKCQTTLANEQVVREGVCERCESPVSQKSMPQWLFKITEYAEELLDFSDMDWPNSVLRMQENWIGKSEGAEIIFDIDSPNISESLSVFTTRPDTLYGVTFMVLAPEHPLVNELVAPEFSEQIKLYQEDSARVSEIERQSTVREKTGVFTGAYCLNPMNNEKVPIWIADYVLATYGTGAIMAVPAHDQRDFEFAKKYELPIRVVIAPENWSENQELEEAYTGKGDLVNSQEFTSLDASDAITKVIQHVERNNFGNKKTQFRIRDWLISRQRYWGAPIPIIHCSDCGTVPVSEDELPIKLPTAVEFLPTGQSPLALAEEFVNVRCPECGASAKRETDTMDTFMCSSWYVYRYTDPANMNSPVGPIATENWPAVDQYTGGAEHAVMHLLYARFFHKFGRDIGVLRGNEPFLNYFAQGQVLGTDGQRMSKSRGNVVAPDEIVDQWGSDAFRAHLAFMGPWENGGPYSEGIIGISRWLNRIWILVNSGYSQKNIPGHDEQLLRLVNQSIQRVTRDLGEKSFNTAIAALMELTNALSASLESGNVTDKNWAFATKTLLLLLAPIAPHISEELWQRSGAENSIHLESWPTLDKSALIVSEIEIPVQINGKLKAKIMVPSGATEDVVIELAKATDQIGKLLSVEPVKRIIYVKNRLLNIVL